LRAAGVFGVESGSGSDCLWQDTGCGTGAFTEMHDFREWFGESRELLCEDPEEYSEWAPSDSGEYDASRGQQPPPGANTFRVADTAKVYGEDRWWYTRPLLSRRLVREDPWPICIRHWDCDWGGHLLATGIPLLWWISPN
jgi:hypothetical protein